jgi:hypothetical protein
MLEVRVVKVAGLKIEGMYPLVVATVGNKSVVCLSMMFATARALEGRFTMDSLRTSRAT